MLAGIQTWYSDRYYCGWHFDTSLIDLDFDSTSHECEKAKTYASIVSQSFQSIQIEFFLLLRLASVVFLIPILFRPFDIQGREPYLCDLIKKTAAATTTGPLTLICIQTFTDQFLLDLVWW